MCNSRQYPFQCKLTGTGVSLSWYCLWSMPSTNRRWKRFLLIYPLFPTSLPYMNSTKALYSNGFLPSTKCLSKRRLPMYPCPREPSWWTLSMGWQSHVPVQRNGWLSSSSVATWHNPNKFGFCSRCSIGCRKPLLETDGACACIPFRDRNASSSDTLMNERELLSPWFLPLTCGFHGDTCAFFLP